MMLDISDLTKDMAQTLYYCLPPRTAEELKKAEAVGKDAWVKACMRHRAAILKVLGIEDPTPRWDWKSEMDQHLKAYAKTGRSPKFTELYNANPASEDVYAAVVSIDEDFWKFLDERINAARKLSELNCTLGSCTPKLCKLMMDAPKEIPLTLFLTHARDIPVDECPDVPLNFIDDYPELLDSPDYNAAFMHAYIASCLKLFFDQAKVDKALAAYTPEDMRRYFPRIAWELSGHLFYENEFVLFDNVTNW